MPEAVSEGVRINYAERGAGEEVVVLVPGLGMSLRTWDATTEALARRYRVLVIDPRGSGESEAPDHPYTAATVAADVGAVLDAAAVESAHLVGQSMGGMIAQDFALAAPQRVRSLTLVSTYAVTDTWSRQVLEGRRGLIAAGGLPLQFSMSVFFVFSPRAYREIGDFIAGLRARIAENPPDEAGYLRQLEFCLGHDASAGLGTVTAPTLVVAGREDFITSAIQNRELAALIPGARYEEFDDCSHGLIWERPERFAELLLEFLDE
ncbi:MAG: alpha/beta fold hydrolase [Actinobacteria bacterium]|nr:alpha/beta fold hydrolase [Actinomycetota bacterium]